MGKCICAMVGGVRSKHTCVYDGGGWVGQIFATLVHTYQ